MKHEYHEGPKAGENFKKVAQAMFQTRKVPNPKRPPKQTTDRKTDGSDKG